MRGLESASSSPKLDIQDSFKSSLFGGSGLQGPSLDPADIASHSIGQLDHLSQAKEIVDKLKGQEISVDNLATHLNALDSADSKIHLLYEVMINEDNNIFFSEKLEIRLLEGILEKHILPLNNAVDISENSLSKIQTIDQVLNKMQASLQPLTETEKAVDPDPLLQIEQDREEIPRHSQVLQKDGVHCAAPPDKSQRSAIHAKTPFGTVYLKSTDPEVGQPVKFSLLSPEEKDKADGNRLKRLMNAKNNLMRNLKLRVRTRNTPVPTVEARTQHGPYSGEIELSHFNPKNKTAVVKGNVVEPTKEMQRTASELDTVLPVATGPTTRLGNSVDNKDYTVHVKGYVESKGSTHPYGAQIGTAKCDGEGRLGSAEIKATMNHHPSIPHNHFFSTKIDGGYSQKSKWNVEVTPVHVPVRKSEPEPKRASPATNSKTSRAGCFAGWDVGGCFGRS